MEEKKYLGMPKNVCFGLSWLFFPLGIVTLCVERANLTKEERQHLISIFVLEGVAMVASFFFSIFFSILGAIIYETTGWAQGHLIGLPFELFFPVIAIIASVKAFMGKYWNIPVVYPLAAKFVHDLPSDAPKAEEAQVVEDAPAAEETKSE
ncbi:MAG: hypothetical protein MJ238_07440 [Bacilli bacterium]|nr:hypothetical protein [Bacilli bacterium]